MFWTIISSVNKVLLPKFFLKQNLEKLSNLEKAIVGWKIFETSVKVLLHEDNPITSSF